MSELENQGSTSASRRTSFSNVLLVGLVIARVLVRDRDRPRHLRAASLERLPGSAWWSCRPLPILASLGYVWMFLSAAVNLIAAIAVIVCSSPAARTGGSAENRATPAIPGMQQY